MKALVFAVTLVVLSAIMATGAVVFGQTATPTTVVSPSPTTTVTSTTTPTPTGQVQGASIPGGAPNTGRGGN
jgi:hypothetical protein